MNVLYAWIPHDKALHALGCAAVALVAAHVAPAFGMLPWIAALSVSVDVGIGWEAWQWWKQTGRVSGADGLAGDALVALATLAGG